MLSAEARLLLALVRRTPPPVADLEPLARGVDAARLAALGVREGVAPLIHSRLAATPELASVVPAATIAAWARAAAVTWARSAVFRAAWRDAVGTLAAAGIASITLKGMALVEQGAYDAAARPMTDIDVLVAADALHDATSALVSGGWHAVEHDAFAEPGAVHLRRGEALLDLHTDVADYPRVRQACRVDHAALWARSRALASDPAARVLGPEDLVLHLAVHGVLGAEFGRLLNYVDLDAAIRIAGQAFDAGLALSEARRWGLTGVLTYVLGVAAAALGTPVPAMPPLSRARRRILARCVPLDAPPSLTPRRSDAAVYLAETMLLDGWGATAAVAFWSVFPSGAWLRRHYQVRSPLGVGLARVGHPLRMGWRVARGAR
jgi:hypothetical protein